MKNNVSNSNNKIFSKFLDKSDSHNQVKSTNINVLLNRVKTKQKIEYQKKIYFSAAASAGLIIFGLIIF